ncbi:hypothetical protein [Brevundimonas diminuta]|uniref:hypothetical protein n=1 Tax=Brevundimonas diminuta TaxID=293 RepID=UPI003D065D38
MKAALLIGAAFLLAGCSQEQSVQQIGGSDFLDCAKSFDALVSEIKNRPAIVAEEYDRGTSAYRDDRMLNLYLVTQPDHPAHPAIFVRHILLTTEGTSVMTSGCGYGDKTALEAELKTYSAFDLMLNAEYNCYLCTDDKLNSPTLSRRFPPPPPPIVP